EGGRVVERGSHAELMARGGAYHRLMAAQAQDGAGRAEPLVALNSAAPPATGEDESADPASLEPTDAILRAQGMGWAQLIRLLADMRLDMFRKLDALAPAYLTRRRTGDLVGVATHDVELIEYFFAHTITPAFVAVLVPVGVLLVLAGVGWPLALALLPFLAW